MRKQSQTEIPSRSDTSRAIDNIYQNLICEPLTITRKRFFGLRTSEITYDAFARLNDLDEYTRQQLLEAFDTDELTVKIDETLVVGVNTATHQVSLVRCQTETVENACP